MMNLFAWFRRRPRLELVARERACTWPTQVKIPPSEADDLRARAAIRRRLAEAKYRDAHAIRSGEPPVVGFIRVVKKP